MIRRDHEGPSPTTKIERAFPGRRVRVYKLDGVWRAVVKGWRGGIDRVFYFEDNRGSSNHERLR